jgi:hypothetical protein
MDVLTCESILLDERYEPKLTNLCDDEYLFERPEQLQTFSLFRAPEGYADRPTNKHDVFSFGVILHLIFTDSGLSHRESHRVGFNLGKWLADQDTLVRPPEIPEKFWGLITQCWSYQPKNRPSFADITQTLMQSNDFVLDGTDLDEYHEYQQRITSQLNTARVVDNSEILESLRSLGIDFDQSPQPLENPE